MSNFEFLLSIFGLLLGFTLVEVLSGLVRTTKSLRVVADGLTPRTRVGWLTPLLAVFVLLDVSSYWVNVWWVRELLPVGYDTVLGGLLIAGGYYFAASMIFPDEARDWPDLNDWFWKHRHQVVIPLILISAVWVPFSIFLGASESGFSTAALIEANIIYFTLIFATLLSKREIVVCSCLFVLIALYVINGVGAGVARIIG